MDFSPTERELDLQKRTRDFVRDVVIPCERDPRQSPHGPSDALRRELNAKARAAGLLSPQCAPEFGGLGLSHRERAIVFEEAGYSLLGPIALHCMAPDEGNMHMLEAVASEAHKRRWLRPLAAGDIRSCFAMTEPPPGAGSDPGAMNTLAVRDGDHYVINGTKWLITGADGAGMMIIMARTMDAGVDLGATIFLVDLPSKGVVTERVIDTIEESMTGGHAVIRFEDLRVHKDDVLGEVGRGFRYAQVRLAPARLTHCMRWLGAARRAHDIAVDYANRRKAFGRTLIEHEGVGFQLADNEIDLHLSRLAVWHCAWVLDQGRSARVESSVAKVAVSEALYRVADRCVQVLGGLGVTGDTPVERIFREIRAFRIYDGPSEVHRWSLARGLATKPA
ncbi:MAG: acyl-CoA dehydrogenase family protein [Rhodospirillales bacterium]|nr:MAG: acyl-CoA dehydrogenase family protein [Rhodospirillales bacterium]